MIRFTTASAGRCADWAAAREKAGKTTRLLRGRKMFDLDALFDEWSAALQFPPYFGFNWGAFDECIGDLEWLRLDGGVVLIVCEAHLVLNEEPGERATLMKVLLRAMEELARPLDPTEEWGRPASSLTIILQAADAQSLSAYSAADTYDGDVLGSARALDDLLPAG